MNSLQRIQLEQQMKAALNMRKQQVDNMPSPVLSPLQTNGTVLSNAQHHFLLASSLGFLASPQPILSSPVPMTRTDQLLALVNATPTPSVPQNSLNDLVLLSKLGLIQTNSMLNPQKCSGRIEPFPEKLLRLLNEVEAVGRTDIISMIADDTFRIHDPVSNRSDVRDCSHSKSTC